MSAAGASAPTFDDVLAATRTAARSLHRTPILRSETLGRAFGGRAYLKAELFQKTGSFKPRGILAKLASLSHEERERGVITISPGNAAAAVAYGAALEGLDCLVVMPRGASVAKVEATRGYGAVIDLEAADAAAAFERVRELQGESGRAFVPPFDDPWVIAGHGTLALEVLEDRPDADVLVVPVGGGGLVSGVALATKGVRPDVRVVGVEPEGSNALGLALAAGEPVRIVPQSIADGLNAPFAGEHCLAVCARDLDDCVTVTEAEICAGFRFLYERAKLAVEPAGAAAVAALLAGKIPDVEGRTAVAVVSGGNVAAEIASGILTPDEG